MLFHQSPTASAEYAGVVPILAERYRVVAWDMPGRGNTYDPDQTYEIEDFARAMLVLMTGSRSDEPTWWDTTMGPSWRSK